MTLEEYQEIYDKVSIPLTDLALVATRIMNCTDLSTAARAYLASKDVFEEALHRHGIEQG